VLAGFKCDIRTDPSVEVTSYEYGQEVAETINEEDFNGTGGGVKCRAYIETSAMTGDNCETLLELLVAVAAEHKRMEVDTVFPPYKRNDDLVYPTIDEILHPKPKTKKSVQKETLSGTSEQTSASIPHKKLSPPPTEQDREVSGQEDSSCQCTVQ